MVSPSQRQNMNEADSLAEVFANAFDISMEEAEQTVRRMDELERLFEEHGHTYGSISSKMALVYIFTSYGYTSSSISKWWGEQRGLSEKTAEKYKGKIRDMIAQETDDDFYLIEDPIEEYLGV